MHYPLFLSLTNQPVVVIGGGTVAKRKIRSLLASRALVTVISPHATRLPKGVRWLRRRYRHGDLRGACLVVAATDDQSVNERVCGEAKKRKLLVNCVAPPSAGNFIVPAVARRGGLTIAVSTGGVNPALAKRLRRDLERLLRKDYPQLRDN
jgi:precorrin-2 dehydrogenase/sirohydrochlorin ferrochelatase